MRYRIVDPMAEPVDRFDPMAAPVGAGPQDWQWTAAHRHSRALSHQPWGLVHLKRVGDLTTACGIPALAWPTFWLASSAEAPEGFCRVCEDISALEGACARH